MIESEFQTPTRPPPFLLESRKPQRWIYPETQSVFPSTIAPTLKQRATTFIYPSISRSYPSVDPCVPIKLEQQQGTYPSRRYPFQAYDTNICRSPSTAIVTPQRLLNHPKCISTSRVINANHPQTSPSTTVVGTPQKAELRLSPTVAKAVTQREIRCAEGMISSGDSIVKKAVQYFPAHMRAPCILRDNPIMGKWSCISKIGSGSFGETYLAMHRSTGDYAAVKVESIKARHPQLLHEAKILRSLQHHHGFPKIYYFGTHMNEFVVIVMERLGSTLEEVFSRWSNRSFSPSLIAILGSQMIDRIESLHSEGYIHRDIKPDNFLVGPIDIYDTIFMIDFGLSKRYRDLKTNAHIPYTDRRSLTGTARYVSLNAHMGIEPSRRDDVESCGFLMVYFMKGGQLPWQGLKAMTKEEKYRKILEKKISTSLEVLTHNLPPELCTFLKYCRNLQFEEAPDYEFLRRLMACIVLRESSGPYFSPVINTKSISMNKHDIINGDLITRKKSLNSRECETADSIQQKFVPSNENKALPYKEHMTLLQAGLKQIYFKKYRDLLSHTTLMELRPPLESLTSAQINKNQTDRIATTRTFFENKRRDYQTHAKARKQKFFCMTCAPRH